MKQLTLEEAVMNLLGGDVNAIGETIHDEEAFERQKELQELIDELLEKIRDVANYVTWEGSVKRASNEANSFLDYLKDEFFSDEEENDEDESN